MSAGVFRVLPADFCRSGRLGRFLQFLPLGAPRAVSALLPLGALRAVLAFSAARGTPSGFCGSCGFCHSSGCSGWRLQQAKPVVTIVPKKTEPWTPVALARGPFCLPVLCRDATDTPSTDASLTSIRYAPQSIGCRLHNHVGDASYLTLVILRHPYPAPSVTRHPLDNSCPELLRWF